MNYDRLSSNTMSHIYSNIHINEIQSCRQVSKNFNELFEKCVIKNNFEEVKKVISFAKKYKLIKSSLDNIKAFMVCSVLMDQESLKTFMGTLNQQIVKEIMAHLSQKDVPIYSLLLHLLALNRTVTSFFADEEVFKFLENYGLSQVVAEAATLHSSFPSREVQGLVYTTFTEKFHGEAYKKIIEAWIQSFAEHKVTSVSETENFKEIMAGCQNVLQTRFPEIFSKRLIETQG